MEIGCFYGFVSKKHFCLYFIHKTTISQFSRACSHYDVIVRSYINGWNLFWYQRKKDARTYTLELTLGLYHLQYFDNPEGDCNKPLRKICF